MQYRIRTKTGQLVHVGQQVEHWQGRANGQQFGVLEGVTRGPEHAGGAKVQVDGREYFARAWQLVVEPV